MPSHSANAPLYSPARESAAHNVLLLVSCVTGLLLGLGVFGYVCYLLMH